ncbi:MAG: type II toxin-antitoxin system VapB family antitoxin [Polyangiales bacterium]
MMRTTIVLDDALLRAAKARAARAGMSLSELVAEALRETLAARKREAPAFEMVTHGRQGSKARHEPADFARALEDEDRATVGH